LEDVISSQMTEAALAENRNETLFHDAARCGDVSTLRKLMEKCDRRGQVLETENDAGQTPLLLACIHGHEAATIALLELGATARKGDSLGDTPLHWLHMFRGLSVNRIATALLENGADVNSITRRNEFDPFYRKSLAAGTPLHRAAAWNNLDAVLALLRHGADPLLPGPGHELSTPLWLACTYHNGEVVQALLEHIGKSRDVQKIVNGGESKDWPLLKPVLDIGYYYINGGDLGRMTRHGERYMRATEQTIASLKAWGASMMLTILPSISQAFMLRSVDISNTLLDIWPEMINKLGGPLPQQPPLFFAVQQDRSDLVFLALSRGADASMTRMDGLNALSHYANYHGGLEIPTLLLEQGLKFEVPANDFQTPFFAAIRNGNFKLARFILENTTDALRHKMINAPCSRGTNFEYEGPKITVLGYLLFDLNPSSPWIIKRLFEIASEFDETVDFIVSPELDYGPFHILGTFNRRQRNDPIVRALAKELIRHYGSADKINYASRDSGLTALRLAVRTLNYDLIAELLSSGADPVMVESDGVSSLSLIQKQIQHTKKYHSGKEEEWLVH
jgi:ankyrin repeat protein